MLSPFVTPEDCSQVLATVVYPHQLYSDNSLVTGSDLIYLVEDPLFFNQFCFHRKKRLLHRLSMQQFAEEWAAQGKTIKFIHHHELESSASVVDRLAQDSVRTVQAYDPNDDWLFRRVTAAAREKAIAWNWYEDPNWLTSHAEADQWIATESRNLFFTRFYIQQRKRLNILLDDRLKPEGGKWSFDTENRKKLPKGLSIPPLLLPPESRSFEQLSQQLEVEFPNGIGEASPMEYPTTRRDALKSLEGFLQTKLAKFGDYEDAMHREEAWLFHSVLTPMLNIGLITPRDILEQTIAFAQSEGNIPLASLEGFLRQVIGWREFIRVIYRAYGRQQRTGNYWSHSRDIPSSFYDATTGIDPIDTVIRRILKHGYCHHIERLMVLGNFMLLCEFHPDAIYKWFMELFVDAYDWVMVPNVYGMSQYADGGLMTTKPYISGSSYILRMSNFSKGPWCPIWDALYWRFIDKHRKVFEVNPRMSMMTRQLDRMGNKLNDHQKNADRFLSQLGN